MTNGRRFAYVFHHLQPYAPSSSPYTAAFRKFARRKKLIALPEFHEISHAPLHIPIPQPHLLRIRRPPPHAPSRTSNLHSIAHLPRSPSPRLLPRSHPRNRHRVDGSQTPHRHSGSSAERVGEDGVPEEFGGRDALFPRLV